MGALRVEKRGKNWQYSFEGPRIAGKRKRISKCGFKTRNAALKAGNEALNEFNHGGLAFKTSDMSYDDLLEYWIKEYCEINCKPKTIEGYRKKIKNYISPALGQYRISSITTPTIQHFINDMVKRQYSRNTLSVLKGILTKSLTFAVANGFLKTNVATNATLPSARNDRLELRSRNNIYLTPDVMKRIFERYPEGTTAHIPLMLGYKCGMRIGEVFALTWDCVDLIKGSIKINKQVQWDPDKKLWYFTSPKYNENRVIAMDPDLQNLLTREFNRQQQCKTIYMEYYQEYYMSSKKEIITSPTDQPVDFVLRRESGEYTSSRISLNFSRIIHYNLNIPDFTFHSLRHTHATDLHEHGLSIKYIQSRLGHLDPKITEKTYLHATDEFIAKCDNCLAEIY